MKKTLIVVCSLVLAAAIAGAFDIPGAGGGGKVDTKKFDELIASIEEVSVTFDEAKVKIDGCTATVAAIAEAHGVTDLMSDPTKAAGLKDAVTEDEKAQLQAQADTIQTLPDDLNAVVEKATGIMGKIPDALTDLTNQISENPMAAASLKDKMDQLNKGKTTLEEVMGDVPALIGSATDLATTITGLL
jgi:small-conductance mechanosensitive channel